MAEKKVTPTKAASKTPTTAKKAEAATRVTKRTRKVLSKKR